MLLVLTILIILFVALFNDVCKYIRLKELKVHLQNSSRLDNNLDHMGLIMKYKIHQQLYENKLSQEEADIIEMKVGSMLSELTDVKEKVVIEKYSMMSIPVLYVINLVRLLEGKQPIGDLDEDNTNAYLDVAYYFERNRLYNKSLKVYDRAIRSSTINRPQYAGIATHQGFCHAIIGEFDEARERYLTVIDDYSDQKVAVTAAILLRYLQGFEDEIKRVSASGDDSISKAEKLRGLFAYKKSLEIFKKLEKNAKPADVARIQYNKAKIFESMNQNDRAIRTYQRIIMYDPKSKYAKHANRRIYINAALSRDNKKLKQVAVNNNKLLKDKSFGKLVDSNKKYNRTDQFAKRIAKNPNLKTAFNIGQNVSTNDNKSKIKRYDKAIKKVDDTIKAQKVAASKRKLIPNKKNDKDKKKKFDFVNMGKMKRMKIFTRDGNVFIGHVIGEDNVSILLKTLVGTVEIEKKRVSKRWRID